jgi:hypothetical protein
MCELASKKAIQKLHPYKETERYLEQFESGRTLERQIVDAFPCISGNRSHTNPLEFVDSKKLYYYFTDAL